MSLKEIIQKADDLWFGRNGITQDREAAVSFFDKLLAGGDVSLVSTSNNLSQKDIIGKCTTGLCCQYRRNTDCSNTVQQQDKSICVIGAGASGLLTLNELQQHGFNKLICYESSNDIGGAFANAYDGAVMTSSNLLTVFGSYPISEYMKDKNGIECTKEHKAEMWSVKEYCSYLESFVKRFNLDQYIQKNTEVVYVRAIGDKWEVHSSSDNRRKVEVFDAICVCSGLHQTPNMPLWCNEEHTTTKPKVIHSSQFIDANMLKGLNVLIIGLGESGSDISLLASKHAKSVKISVREQGSGYVLSRFTCDEVADLNTSRGFGRNNVWGPSEFRVNAELLNKASQDGNGSTQLQELARCFIGTDDLSKLDLMAVEWNARYDNLPYDRFGTKNYSFLEAINSYGAECIGSVNSWDDIPSDTDIIICCTGYTSSFPFFDEESHPDVNLRENSVNHRLRYKHVIDLNVGSSLAFIGYSRPAFGAVPPLSEMAARYWALLLTGKRNISARDESILIADRAYEERLFARDASRVTSLVQYHRSMDGFARLIGCMPPLEDLKLNHYNEYLRVMHSSLSGVQYRITGDGWSEEAWKDLRQHPLPRYSRQPKSAFRIKLKAGLFSE